jgi:hypothetical protein
MEHTANSEEALALALKYQLVSDRTSLFLAYVREDKVVGLPQVHQVPQMMTGGWGGHSLHSCYMSCAPAPALENILNNTKPLYNSFASLKEKSETHSPQSQVVKTTSISLPALLAQFAERALTCPGFAEALRPFLAMTAGTDLEEAIERIGKQENMSAEDVWVVLLDWLREKFEEGFTPSRPMLRLLRFRLRPIAAEKNLAIRTALTAAFPAVGTGAGIPDIPLRYKDTAIVKRI